MTSVLISTFPIDDTFVSKDAGFGNASRSQICLDHPSRFYLVIGSGRASLKFGQTCKVCLVADTVADLTGFVLIKKGFANAKPFLYVL